MDLDFLKKLAGMGGDDLGASAASRLRGKRARRCSQRFRLRQKPACLVWNGASGTRCLRPLAHHAQLHHACTTVSRRRLQPRRSARG